jgi:hypothetical protein
MKTTSSGGEANVVEQVPLASEFAGANDNPGKLFGDKTHRPVPSKGADLSMGLSMRQSFADEDPAETGQDRSDANGKPGGPAKGPVDNSGASASLTWG